MSMAVPLSFHFCLRRRVSRRAAHCIAPWPVSHAVSGTSCVYDCTGANTFVHWCDTCMQCSKVQSWNKNSWSLESCATLGSDTRTSKLRTLTS